MRSTENKRSQQGLQQSRAQVCEWDRVSPQNGLRQRVNLRVPPGCADSSACEYSLSIFQKGHLMQYLPNVHFSCQACLYFPHHVLIKKRLWVQTVWDELHVYHLLGPWPPSCAWSPHLQTGGNQSISKCLFRWVLRTLCVALGFCVKCWTVGTYVAESTSGCHGYFPNYYPPENVTYCTVWEITL